MTVIAFVTCRPFPTLSADDVPLAEALLAAGYQVEAAPWDDEGINWTRFAAVVIRSTWNYHLHPAAFRAWLRRLKTCDLPVYNPVEILEWNMDKGYLKQLAELHIPLPPTRFLDKDSCPDLRSIFQTTGWHRAVIKPCISATAHNTWVTGPGTAAADNARLHELLRADRYMIQEFMEEIHTDGEYSLLFFGRQYSHAVRKTAQAGDFRVQERFGGTSLLTQASGNTIHQASTILHQAISLFGNASPLYARVDGVIHNGIFTLMELELVEPTLFFTQYPPAVEQFVYFFNSSLTAASIC